MEFDSLCLPNGWIVIGKQLDGSRWILCEQEAEPDLLAWIIRRDEDAGGFSAFWVKVKECKLMYMM